MKLTFKNPPEKPPAHPDRSHRVVVKHHAPLSPAAGAAPGAAPKKSRVPWLWIHVCLMLVIGGTAFGIFMHMRTVAGQSERREALALQAARSSAAGSMDRIDLACKRVQEFAPVVAQWLTEGSDLVRSVMANSPVLRASPAIMPVEAPAIVPVEAAAPQAAPQDSAAAATGAPPALAAAPVVPDDEVDPDRPYGMPSRAKVDALRREAAQPSAPKSDPGQPSVRAAAKPQGTDAPPRTPIEAALVALQQHAAEMAALSAQATETRPAAQGLVENAGQKTRSFEVSEDVSRLKEMAASAEGAQEESSRQYKGAEARIAEIRRLKLQIESDRKESERKSEQARAEKERKELIASELAASAAAHKEAATYVKQHQYAQAVSNLASALATMQTGEGRRALQVHVDRFQLMQELKNFITARACKEPFAWGWGSGPTARDVIGIDESGIKLRGGHAAWEDLDPEQMLKFLRFYMAPEKVDKELCGRISLAAAVYFSETGQSANASKYMKDAVIADIRLQKDVSRLLESP